MSIFKPLRPAPPAEPDKPAEPPKRGRGRPATGETPAAERKRRSRANQRQAGGHRVSVELGPDAAAALAEVMIVGEHPTERAAIEASVIGEAKRLRRSQKKP